MSDLIQDVTDTGFGSFVANAPVPVLVDFWAPWCVPCQRLTPLVEAVAEEYGSALIVAKMNVDQHWQVAQKYQVKGIPTLLLFKAGKVVEAVHGSISKDGLTSLLAKHVVKTAEHAEESL
jgi:thioredoxin 1